MKKFKEKFMAGLLCGAMLFSQMMLPQLVQAETVVSVNAVSGNLLSASTVNQEPGEQPALSQNSVTLSENTVSLSAAQKNFIDAVSALDKEKLIRLAIVFMLAGSEESRAAFTVEYEKVEAADSLYGLLSAEGTEHEQVQAGYAVLEALVQEINVVLYPVPQADAAYEAGTMSLIEQAAALGAPGSSRSGGMAVFAMPNGYTSVGSVNQPFKIGTPEVLAELAVLVNSGATYGINLKYAEAYYELTENIDLNIFNSDDDLTNGNWTPIGISGNKFNGHFDGKNHTVSHMTIKGAGIRYVGLFGFADKESEIKNLGVVEANINNTFNEGITGGITGGVAGFAGSINNSYATGTVTGGQGGDTGGVAGSADSISNCYATGSVTGGGLWSRTGGVAGYADSINNSYATGSVTGGGKDSFTGGVAGYVVKGIKNCAALSNSISFTGSQPSAKAGRVIGAKNSSASIVGTYAWNGMTLVDIDKNVTATVSNGAANNKDGADMTYTAPALSQQFSAVFLDGENQPDAAWTFADNKLPILRGMPSGTQSDELPAWITGAASNVGTSEDNPFKISTAEQLDNLRQLVNGDIPSSVYGYTNTTGSYYRLENDIDLYGFDSDGNRDNGNWTPIGNSSPNAFKGKFNGNSFVVKNMSIIGLNIQHVGLFGNAYGFNAPAEIKNLGVVNVNIKNTYNDNGGSYSDVGGVAGYAATISNCYVIGSVTGDGLSSKTGGVAGLAVSISDCYATGSVTGGGKECCTGGVTGIAGSINNCYATGSVTGGGEDSCIGGVTGIAASINNSYMTGSVTGGGKNSQTGGVAGHADAISNCYAIGPVTSTTPSGVAGVVGGVAGHVKNSIENCVALSNFVTGGANDKVGRVIGGDDNSVNGSGQLATIKNTYAWNGMSREGGTGLDGEPLLYFDDTKGLVTGSLSGPSFTWPAFMQTNSWEGGTSKTRPILTTIPKEIQSTALPLWINSATGTSAAPFEISTAEQLNDLRKIVNGTAAISAYGYKNTADSYYVLTADIDLNGFNDDGNPTNGNWTPIGIWSGGDKSFKGHFNGQNFAVKNMTIKQESLDYVGLFGYTYDSSSVQNLRLEQADIQGRYYVGGVAGRQRGTIANCSVSGSISGEYYVGGISGWPSKKISRCTVTATVHGTGDNVGGVAGWTNVAIEQCSFQGKVSGDGYVGGIVGSTDESVTHCYAIGSVTGINICVGGVAGRTEANMNSCYSAVTVKGGDSVGGVVGRVYNNDTPITITNCVALGTSVTTTINTSEVGRVAGSLGDNASVVDNYALNTMTVKTGAGSSAIITNGAAYNKNGANLYLLTDIGLSDDGATRFDWSKVGIKDSNIDTANGEVEWILPESDQWTYLPKLFGREPFPQLTLTATQMVTLTLESGNGTFKDLNKQGQTQPPIKTQDRQVARGMVTLPGNEIVNAPAGMYLSGWKKDDTTTYPAGSSIKITKNMTLQAVYAKTPPTGGGDNPGGGSQGGEGQGGGSNPSPGGAGTDNPNKTPEKVITLTPILNPVYGQQASNVKPNTKPDIDAQNIGTGNSNEKDTLGANNNASGSTVSDNQADPDGLKAGTDGADTDTTISTGQSSADTASAGGKDSQSTKNTLSVSDWLWILIAFGAAGAAYIRWFIIKKKESKEDQ